MKSIFVITLCLTFIECQSFDWCPVIKPNGTYSETRLYQRIVGQLIPKLTFWLNNNQGMEWEIRINGAIPNIKIEFDHKTLRPVSEELVQSIIYEEFISEDRLTVINCNLMKEKMDPNNQTLDCRIWSKRGHEIENFPKEKQFVVNYYPKSLIFRLFPSKWNHTNGSSVLIINRDNRTQRQKIRFEYKPNDNTSVSVFIWMEKCDDSCSSEPFIDEISDSLFRQIESIVEYFDEEESSFGYVLWFNINGRPKYCSQPEGQQLFESCKEENLKTVFEECFSSEKGSNLTLIIFIVLLIIGLALIAIIVCIFKRKQQKDRKEVLSSSDTDSSQSVSSDKQTTHSVTEEINKRQRERPNSPLKLMRFKTEELEKEFNSPKESPKESNSSQDSTESTSEPRVQPKPKKRSPKIAKSQTKQKPKISKKANKSLKK